MHEEEKQKKALVKSQGNALHKSANGLVRRAILDIYRLIDVNNIDVVIYYPEIGVTKAIEMFIKMSGYSNVKFKWFKKIWDFNDWIYNHDFDLIIMGIYRIRSGRKREYDVGMVRQIRNYFPDCRIIVVSALGGYKNKVLMHGANHFIQVPFSVNDFLAPLKNEFLKISNRGKKKSPC